MKQDHPRIRMNVAPVMKQSSQVYRSFQIIDHLEQQIKSCDDLPQPPYPDLPSPLVHWRLEVEVALFKVNTYQGYYRFWLMHSPALLVLGYLQYRHCMGHHRSRFEISRHRCDKQLCKIRASCVYFPGKQHNFSNNLRKTTRFTHTKCNFALKLLKIYSLS